MEINKTIKQLKQINQENTSDKVFTMYLNTDPSDPEQQGGKWRISFKNGLRNFESYLTESGKEDELKNFKIVKEKVTNFVHENEKNLRRGIIVFATAASDVWYSYFPQMRLTTKMFWQDTPVLDQLQQLEEQFPETGIILVQKNQVKVMETHLNEVQETSYYELDLDTDDWREMEGPQPAHTPQGQASGNVQTDNFEERYNANRHRWYKSIAKKMDKMAKNHDWKQIYVIGESDYSTELKKQMDTSVQHVVHKNMLEHKEDQILKEVAG
ncbi:VLRF1 family aeRF1-type release factor [Virgibacillus sp. W0181]|uniref:VLRF1 family aeRF1-type release factor n=1 Tax=Virgibacillus sp. W0181 TaxID=3391581 RepID=UPI003F457C62